MVESNIIKLTDDIFIKHEDRVTIFGKTGTGKTEIFKRILYPQYDRIVFWDVKHENTDIYHDILVSNPTDLKKNIEKHNKILYQPKDISTEDFDSVCKIVFETGDIAIYVDEVAAVSMVNKIEYWHRMIMTQGRGKGVGIIQSSQRPKDIHSSIISESEHFFVFKLTLDPDIKKLENIIGRDITEEVKHLSYHYFIYHNVRDDVTRILKPISLATKGIPKLEYYRPSLKDYITKIRV